METVSVEEFKDVLDAQQGALDAISEKHREQEELRGSMQLKDFILNNGIRLALESFDRLSPEWDLTFVNALELKLKKIVEQQSVGQIVDVTIEDGGYVEPSEILSHGGYTEYGFFHIGRVTVDDVSHMRRLNIFFNKSRTKDVDTRLYAYRAQYASENTVMDMFKEIAIRLARREYSTVAFDRELLSYQLT